MVVLSSQNDEETDISVSTDITAAPIVCKEPCPRRVVRFAEESPETIVGVEPTSIFVTVKKKGDLVTNENARSDDDDDSGVAIEELWYTEQDYREFERDTLEQAKVLQASPGTHHSWARSWLKVFLIIETTKSLPKMQSMVNQVKLTLDETNAGLQGRYLRPICAGMVARRAALLTNMQNLQKRIKDPEQRAAAICQVSNLYSRAPRLYATLTGYVSGSSLASPPKSQ